jgi:hypothetical protein
LFVFVHVCLFVFLVPVVEPRAEAGAVTLKAMKANAGRYESGCVQDVHVVVVVVVVVWKQWENDPHATRAHTRVRKG